MVGYGRNKGIVPVMCEELFKGIESSTADKYAPYDNNQSFAHVASQHAFRSVVQYAGDLQ